MRGSGVPRRHQRTVISVHRSSGVAVDSAALIAAFIAGLLGLVLVLLGYDRARAADATSALRLLYAGLVLTYASAFAYLLRRTPTLRRRLLVVQFFGLVLLAERMAQTPLEFLRFDELLHLRTLADLQHTRELLVVNPLLTISPYYPGLETFTGLLQDLSGASTPWTVTAVIVLCRALLMAALFCFVLAATDSARVAGVGAMLYASSPQFYGFNVQYAYQTLALPLAVTAVAGLLAAQRTSDLALRRSRSSLAAVCLVGVVVTHHVTSWLTFSLLCLWYLALRLDRAETPSVSVVRRALVLMALATALWTAVVGPRLAAYLGPVLLSAAEQLGGVLGLGDPDEGEAGRELFSDAGGEPTPVWQRVVMLGAVLQWSLLVALAGLARLRRLLRNWSWTAALLFLLAGGYPLTLAVRFSPTAAQVGDRATTFLYFAMALLGARWICARHVRPDRRLIAGALATGFATIAFLGNLILGSGPDWARIPGPYLVAADSRSVDDEVRRAVEWVDDNLQPGSRIAADRVASVLLLAQTRTWPVSQSSGGVNVGLLYFADNWGPPQQAVAERYGIRYFWVDERLSSGLPRVGNYFEPGEAPAGQRLTDEQLGKFADVPGARLAYSHGPIRIYDFAPTGVPVVLTTTGEAASPSSRAVHMAAGVLLVALLHVAARRLRATPTAPVDGTLMLGAVMATITVAGLLVYALGLSLSPLSSTTALFLICVTAVTRQLWRGPMVPGTGGAPGSATGVRELPRRSLRRRKGSSTYR